jgi:hypothetical protein
MVRAIWLGLGVRDRMMVRFKELVVLESGVVRVMVRVRVGARMCA